MNLRLVLGLLAAPCLFAACSGSDDAAPFPQEHDQQDAAGTDADLQPDTPGEADAATPSDASSDTSDDVLNDAADAAEDVTDDAPDAGPDAPDDVALDAVQHDVQEPDAQDDASEQDVAADTNPIDCVNPPAYYAKEGLAVKASIDLSNYASGRYSMHEQVEVVAPSDGNTLTLFGEDFTFTNTSAPYVYDGHRITFCLPPFRAGDTLRVSMDYDFAESDVSMGMGLHAWSGYQNNGTVVGPFNEPYFAPMWLVSPQSLHEVDPEHDESVAVDRFELEVVTPAESWTVAGPGGLPVQEGRAFRFTLDKRTPLYAISFAASPNSSRFSVGQTAGGMHIYGVAPAAHQQAVFDGLYAGVVASDWMEQNLAPYEFGPSLDLVLVPGFGGGMEHTSALWVGTELMLYYHGYQEFLVVHETVHQWFGDSVQFADWPHFWLAEGFTEWVTNYRVMGLLESASEFQDRKLDYRMNASQLCSDPSNGPLRFDDSDDMMDHFNNLDLYYVYGAAFLQMIHARLVDRYAMTFDQMLADWYAAKRLQQTTTEQFRDFVGAYTGDPDYWNQFFDEWAYADRCPQLRLDHYSWNGSQVSFVLRRNNASLQTIDALPITIRSGAQSQTVRVSMAPGQQTVDVQVPVSSTPTNIVVDAPNSHVFSLSQQVGWTGPTPRLAAP